MRIVPGLMAAVLGAAIAAPVAAQDQQDPLLAIRELFGRYELPGPGANAFPTYQEAFSLMVEDDAITRYVTDARPGLAPPTAALVANAEALTKVDEALAATGCLVPRASTWDAPIPWVPASRQMARLLVCDGLAAESRGDYTKALDRYCDAVDMAQDLARGSTATGKLVQAEITSIGLRSLRRACLTGDVPEDALAATADRLAALEASDLPVGCALAYGMMWTAEAALDMMRRPLAEIPPEFEVLPLLATGANLEGFLAEVLDYYSRYMQLSEHPYREGAGLDPRPEDYKHPFMRFVLPAGAKVRAKEPVSVAALRGTRVLVALVRYRVAHGEYPEELAVLAPTLLPEVPPDPFTGEPFVYAREPELRLYSVGGNVVDDGGRGAGGLDVVLAPVE